MTFIRSALFNLWFYSLTFICTLLGCLAVLIMPKLVTPISIQWARLNLIALRVICGIKLDVQGREHLPAGATIIASQHQSAFDTFIWLLLVPRAAYVLKQELARIPLFGWLLIKLGNVAVDRSAGASALRKLLKEGGEVLDRGGQLVIFPEGTRMPAGQRGPLQPGVAALASHTGAKVVPVATDSGYCWGRRAFVKRPGTVHVLIRPALPIGMRRPELLAALQHSWDTGQDLIRESCG